MDKWSIVEVADLQRPTPYSHDTSTSPMLVQGDAAAHTWSVAVYNGGTAASLSGYSVRAMFVRNGNTVMQAGSISGNVVTVSVPADAYKYAGIMQGFIRLYTGTEGNEQYVTIAQKLFRVRESITGGIVADEETLPALSTLAADVEAYEARLQLVEANTTAPTVSTIKNLYVQASDPGDVPNGSIWIQTGV